MILIVTHTEDYTVDYIADLLNRRRKPFVRLNTDLLPSTPFEIHFNDENRIIIKGVSSFTGMWFRRVKLPEINHYSEAVNRFIALDYDSLLFNLIASLDVSNKISDPYKIYQAENKIFQLRLAREVGFTTPTTLVTSSPEQLKKFVEKNSAIIKPIRTGKVEMPNGNHLIYTNILEDKTVIDGNDLTPCIIQKNIDKAFEVRVTVVHRSVFAAKVESQKESETVTDWRRKQLTFEKFDLPLPIQEKCIKLIERLELNFGAIDLIYSTDGNYYFLEINPNGQWVWIELDTGLKISEALIKFLYGE